MVFITKETYEQNINNETLRLNEKNIGDGLKHTNLPVIIRKYHSEYREHWLGIVDEREKQPTKIFLHEHLALVTIKDRRTYSDEFKTGLGFNAYDAINTKQQTVLQEMMNLFEGENMQTQYCPLN